MSKKTFCIDNVENIPSDIINMICSEKSEFHSWFHDDSGTHYIKSDHSIIYRNEKAAEIFELLRNYLSTYIIRAYHATRIIDDQEIIQDGLHPFELNSYTERIVGVLLGQGISIETGQLISKKYVDLLNGRDARMDIYPYSTLIDCMKMVTINLLKTMAEKQSDSQLQMIILKFLVFCVKLEFL